MLRLLKPDEIMKEEILRYNDAWKERGLNLVPHAAKLGSLSFGDWLKNTRDLETVAEEPFVTQEVWFLFSGDTIVGACTLRHSLNAYLLAVGGQIGYGVHPEERKNGYATYMLEKTLRYAKSKGLKKILVTCTVGNTASEKTLEKCGGIFENIMEDGENRVARYWFHLQ